MLAFGPGLFQALLATLFFGLPSAFVFMMVGGLANPRAEAWEAPDAALRMKARYRVGARWLLHTNRALLAVFLLEVVAFLALRSEDCDATGTHLGAAAWNIARGADAAFLVVALILALFAIAGAIWSVVYLVQARSENWQDPRRKDGAIVHLVLVPLSLVLMWVAFAIVPRMVCPFVVTP